METAKLKKNNRTVECLNKLFYKHEEMVLAVTYNILFTNDICEGLIYEALQMLQKSKYYRHKMKEYTRKASAEKIIYEKRMNEIIGKLSDFYANCNDTFVDNIEDDIERLYLSFKEVFDREGMDSSELMARVETARTMVEFSCIQFDKRMEELKKCDCLFGRVSLNYLRLTEMHRLLNLIMDSFRPGKTINLDTEECQKALDVVMIKIGDIYAIANAIKVHEKEDVA